jgi:hypothetical protein
MSKPTPPCDSAEIALTDYERIFLRQMVETWEESLGPAHVLHRQRGGTRTVRYQLNTEPTRLFVSSAPPLPANRFWRDLRSLARGLIERYFAEGLPPARGAPDPNPARTPPSRNEPR